MIMASRTHACMRHFIPSAVVYCNCRLRIHFLVCRFGRVADAEEPPQRVKLWMEMLGLTSRFKGNRATQWGTQHESSAASLFHSFVDGHADMHTVAFDVLRGTDGHGRSLDWIGASPDGLLMPCGKTQGILIETEPAKGSRYPHVNLGAVKGILEIKCPFKLCAAWNKQSCLMIFPPGLRMSI